MSKIASLVNWINPVVLVTTLACVPIALYPAKTLSQTANDRDNAIRQTGCLSGYSNGTYGGSRPVTRYEFAAGMNACLNQVNQLLPANRANLATKADFEVLLKRQIELNQQLRDLKGRVDNISPAKN